MWCDFLVQVFQKTINDFVNVITPSGYTLDLGPVQDQLIDGWSIKRMRSGEIALQHKIAGEWVSAKLELIGLQAIKFTLSTLVGKWQIGALHVKASLGGYVIIRRKKTQENNLK